MRKAERRKLKHTILKLSREELETILKIIEFDSCQDYPDNFLRASIFEFIEDGDMKSAVLRKYT